MRTLVVRNILVTIQQEHFVYLTTIAIEECDSDDIEENMLS